MIFFLNLLISLVYCTCVDTTNKIYKYSYKANFILFLPLIGLWTLICGSQYYVGTDYPSYIKIFNGVNLDYYSQSGEVLFVELIKLCNSIGIHGQGIYFVIYTISFIFLFSIIIKCEFKYSAFFILLYIVVSSLFNNQLNIIRQAFTIYLGTHAAICSFHDNKYKAIFLIIISTLFHITAILFIVYLIPTRYITKLTTSTIMLILLLGTLISPLLNPSFLNNIAPYLPANYAWHIQGGFVTETNLLNMITKYIFLPFYFLAIRNFPKYELSKIGEILFKWGIIGFSIRIALNNLFIVNRISMIFLLISILPIYYYFNYLIKERHILSIFLAITFLIGIYAAKVLLFPIGEYSYQSIFFNSI